jgi:hypothetical protein
MKAGPACHRRGKEEYALAFALRHGCAGDRGLASPAHARACARVWSGRKLDRAVGGVGRREVPFPFSDLFKKLFYFVFSPS